MDPERERAMFVGLNATRRQMLDGDDSVLAAVEVARHIELAARRDYARRVTDARSAGYSWEQIATAAPGFVAVYGPEAGRAVFDSVALPTGRVGERDVAWRCGECDGLVLDHGPAGGNHPADAEPGHTEGCARLAADIARYVARREEFDIDEPSRAPPGLAANDGHLGRGRGVELW